MSASHPFRALRLLLTVLAPFRTVPAVQAGAELHRHLLPSDIGLYPPRGREVENRVLQVLSTVGSQVVCRDLQQSGRSPRRWDGLGLL